MCKNDELVEMNNGISWTLGTKIFSQLSLAHFNSMTGK